jgi:hypothetical protein
VSDNASQTSQQSQTGAVAAGGDEGSTPRRPASGLTEKQGWVLRTTIRFIMGFWHCMQESIIANLTGNHDEWSFFARDWRKTEGRLKFLLSAGNVNEALDELFSAVAGLVKWWLQRYRRTQPDAPDYDKFDEFMDSEAASSPVLARLRGVIEHTLLTKGFHDSMRQGMLRHVRLLLEQLGELCASTGLHKYTRMLMDFKVQVRTMPEADLVQVFNASFVDMGSFYCPSNVLL